ncbi:MAG: hypothetical protein PHE10_00545 [Kiritimatiellae bacterium]|nr:hypothetical protein [Kiritimatiellia bacterium]
MNKFTRNLAVALAAAGSTLSAAELTLTGAAPGVWNFATSCWTNSAGAYRAFADGDDALIDDSVFTGGKITFDARVTPESVTFDLANDLVLTNSAYNYGFGWDLKQWTKKGVGTLIVSTYDGRTSTSANGNLNTGRIDVVAGTLKNGNTSLNMFGSMNYGYDLFVHPGATYWSATHHGSYTGAAKCGPRITVETNGTFKITGVLTFAKTLALNGGNIDWSEGGSSYGPLVVHDKLVIGPAPQPFVVEWPAGDPDYFGISVNGTNGNSLVIQVADITGDANPDAIFSNYFMRAARRTATSRGPTRSGCLPERR